MCWVMPPCSLATTLVARMASRSDVFPWSTCPMTVTTGDRGARSSGRSSGFPRSRDAVCCASCSNVITEASEPNSMAISIAMAGSSGWLMVSEHPPRQELGDDVLGLSIQLLGELLHRDRLGQLDPLRYGRQFWLLTRRDRGFQAPLEGLVFVLLAPSRRHGRPRRRGGAAGRGNGAPRGGHGAAG